LALPGSRSAPGSVASCCRSPQRCCCAAHLSLDRVRRSSTASASPRYLTREVAVRVQDVTVSLELVPLPERITRQSHHFRTLHVFGQLPNTIEALQCRVHVQHRVEAGKSTVDRRSLARSLCREALVSPELLNESFDGQSNRSHGWLIGESAVQGLRIRKFSSAQGETLSLWDE
jgi:hypothetical protein